ncbi:MAG: transposase [Methyloglobulus sp.]|nr:transposase [Methyloglobulus sp.]
MGCPSDIYPLGHKSREQFERIRGLLESAREKTKPRKVDLYDVFCGLLYVLKSGYQYPEGIKGRKAKTSFLVIDAQGVGNTDTAKRKGYDTQRAHRC